MELRIVEVVQRLSLCRDPEAVTAVLREAIRSLTGADGATVILREGDYCHYADEDAIGPLWKGKRFPVYSCISGTCMTTRRQIAVEDVYEDGRIPHDLYRPTFVRSLVVTPIRSRDPIGAIGAYWAERHAASDRELATLQALADSAAVAYENASLIESLRQASRRKDDFMVMLAHELRNPLAPALNAVHLLRSTSALRGEGAWAADVLERQIAHLGRITDELLDTARAAAGKVRLERNRMDLAQLLREVLADYRAPAASAQVELEAAVPETPVWVDADATRLRQVVANLLDNALKFTPPCGKVVATLEADLGNAVLRVRDNGQGIEPEFLPHVFETFAQADKSLERTRGGLGLGLTIARTLAQAHGGTLEAHSEGSGRGAELILRLPLEKQPAAIAPAPPRSGAPTKGRKLKLLVVEDNADAADSLKMLLEMSGHEVEVARDGPSGVRAARQHRPDVVLCDIGLPGMDGYQVARAIRADAAIAGARLIALTGYGDEAARAQTRAAGFEEHLTKPVAPEALLRKLEAASTVRNA